MLSYNCLCGGLPARRLLNEVSEDTHLVIKQQTGHVEKTGAPDPEASGYIPASWCGETDQGAQASRDPLRSTGKFPSAEVFYAAV